MNQLTPKEQRAKVLMAKLQDEDLASRLKDYHHFIDTLLHVHEALTYGKVKKQSWQQFSQTLLMKFAFHGFTLHQLWSGLPLSSTYYEKEVTGVSFFDIPSAKAVLRSQMETFLMYHYIYVNPPEDDTKELRYYSWIYTGLVQRQKFPSRTTYAQRQRQKDLQDIERIKNIIVNLPAYKHLTSKQQGTLIKEGSAKLFSHWSTIMEETGFAKDNSFQLFYTMLCVYAHTEGISAMQLNASMGDPSFHLLASLTDSLHSMELVCMMITAIITRWPAARERFEQLPQRLQWDIEILTRLGKKTSEATDKK